MDIIRPVTLTFVVLAMCALYSAASVQTEYQNQPLLGFPHPSGLASNVIRISTVEPCRLGDTFSVSCEVSSKITQCLWEVNGNQKMTPAPRISESELGEGTWKCAVEVKATEDSHGSWVCKIFTEFGGGVVQHAETAVTIISVPEISLRPHTVLTTITAGEEKEVVCVLDNARPVPSVVWKIGEIELDRKNYKVISQVGKNTRATMISTLKWRFAPEDNNKILQCIAKADWLGKEENIAAQTILDIQFPPMPQTAITRYGFEMNQPGQVQITVHANPRPYSAFWTLPTPSMDTLEVEGKPDMQDPIANNYVGLSGKDNGNNTYTYRLHISSVQLRDSDPGITFQVSNMVGTSEKPEQYTVQLITHLDKTAKLDDFQNKERSDSPFPFLYVFLWVTLPVIIVGLIIYFVFKLCITKMSLFV